MPVLRQQAVELTGHESLEMPDRAAFAQPGPFAVRTRQDTAAVRRQVSAPDLGFFTAHHIKLTGTVQTAQARRNVQQAPGSVSGQRYRHGDELLRRLSQAGRASR